ncbi:MAG: hypothetical protein N3B13_02535 [Deltaproteobacteria bacterium]|nr:hypothetical protein [Deltaproteobacteria bacterium]
MKNLIITLAISVMMLWGCDWYESLLEEENGECKKFNSLKASQGAFEDQILLSWVLPCDEMYYMDIYRSDKPDKDFVHVHHIEKDTLTYRLDYVYYDNGLCSATYSGYCNVKFEPQKKYYYYIVTTAYVDSKGIGEVKSNVAEGWVR